MTKRHDWVRTLVRFSAGSLGGENDSYTDIELHDDGKVYIWGQYNGGELFTASDYEAVEEFSANLQKILPDLKKAAENS